MKFRHKIMGVTVFLGVGVGVADALRENDAIFWPKSAQDRIASMAKVLRKIEVPARWCTPIRHINSVPEKIGDPRLRACIAQIQPVSDYVEHYPRDHMKRFYRGRVEGYFCEVTLSTVFNDDRIVGSDCFYGLFRDGDDIGVGMTDDPFG
jgi:hypothetical protein